MFFLRLGNPRLGGFEHAKIIIILFIANLVAFSVAFSREKGAFRYSHSLLGSTCDGTKR